MVKPRDGCKAFLEVVEAEVFVGGVDFIGIQAKTHEDGFDAEELFEERDDGDGSAAAHGHGFFFEAFSHGAVGCSIADVVDGHQVGMSAVEEAHFDIDAGWGDLAYVVGKEFGYFAVVLVGYEAHADFGMGAGGQDGLRAFACIAAPHAVDVEGGADTYSFDGGIAHFAAFLTDAEVFFKGFQVERCVVEGAAFFFGGFAHLVVKARYSNAVVGIVHLGDHPSQFVGGVGHSSTEESGVKISIGPCHFYFHVAQSAQAYRNGGCIAVDDAGIGDEYDIALEHISVVSYKWFEVFGAYFFFAFDDALDIAGQFTGGIHSFQHLDVHVDLALVVAGSAGEDGSLGMDVRRFDHGFEGWTVPKVERIGGLHVIVTVDEYCR